MKKNPDKKAVYFNREWSWLRFNERVLEEAEDPSNPILERIKFLGISAANLDEFFMVRVAGLYRQLDAGIRSSGVDRRPPQVQIEGVAQILRDLLPRQEALLAELLQTLASEGVRFVNTLDMEPAGRAYIRRYYDEVVYPILTPMIVGPTHPWPNLLNMTLYLVLKLEQVKAKSRKTKERLAFIGLSRVLPRFIVLGHSPGEVQVIPLEAVLTEQLPRLFAGYILQAVSAVRVTRDADFALDEEAAEDLRRAISKKLLGRRHGAAVRLEHGVQMEDEVRQVLQENLDVDPLQHYPQRGMMQLCDLMQLYEQIDRPELKFSPLTPLLAPRGRSRSIFQWLKSGPQLFYHPYHSFDPIAELVAEAADDPDVLAIKQTFYRTSGNSPIVKALTRSAENGKQVTAVIELRARFDEERNLEWAHRLEQAGAHVVYGLLGLKTHCKALLVVRREKDGIHRYVHFGTGNYNDTTARIYTDMGLLACDEQLGEDASALFNVITGATQPPAWNKVEMAPTGLRRRFLQLIEREIDKSTRRSAGRIMAKMNALQDGEVIDALYRASRAGVRIDLIVRGICCLIPGLPGLSENIRVRSIVGRYLEHARIFWFRNGGQEELFLSSADWMPRNLDHRIELLFPVEDPAHKKYIMSILELQLKDNIKARELQPDGLYRRVKGKKPLNSQETIYELTRQAIGREDEATTPHSVGRFVPLGRAGTFSGEGHD